jgi:hypothetical protein
MSDLAEKVHAMSGALEYSEADRTLVWTDRIGSHEYGASAIVADHVLPWVGRLIAEAADPQNTLAESRPSDRLAAALHSIGGEFCQPFTTPEEEPGWPGGHPVAMHNSQAAAIRAALAEADSAAPAKDPE